MPATTFSLLLLIAVVGALVMQPDFGQTMLISLLWGTLFFIAGMRVILVFALGGTALLGLAVAYVTLPHVAVRIKRFLDPSSGDTFQVDTAVESFYHGGWLGRGPGEGTVKRILPDAHADFVFAVGAEEFGIVLCLALAGLFAFVVLRALTKAKRNDDAFARFAIAGLAILFGAQSAINMAVNLSLIPAKGMTLPFISYGGSSMISLAYGMGMLLAFTRERPRAALLPSSEALLLAGSSALMAERLGPPLVVVAAGGTGGHLFAAEALGLAFLRRGITVDLITDERAIRYGSFPGRSTHIVQSATFAAGAPLRVPATAIKLGRGVVEAIGLMGRLRPVAVVGFGGYPTVPPVAAAALRRIPTLIHEQNGVLGRANRSLAPWVTAIATGFPGVFAGNRRLAAKATHTGTPIRPAVVEAAATPYPDAEGPFSILAFGGSQGARIMADIVPEAIELVPMAVRARLSVVQQARDEDIARVRAAYERMGVPVEIAPFFRDLPQRMARSHLVISRSGASTVAELAAIGRPSILVPLPHALDQDQRANAQVLETAGGAIMFEQVRFTPDRLATEIARLAANRPALAAMATAAHGCGILDAADRLADLVTQVAAIPARADSSAARSE